MTRMAETVRVLNLSVAENRSARRVSSPRERRSRTRHMPAESSPARMNRLASLSRPVMNTVANTRPNPGRR